MAYRSSLYTFYVFIGLQIFYSSGQSPKYGMELSTCEKTYEVNLAHNERIVRVDVHSGWMIDQLTFHTNLGMYCVGVDDRPAHFPH